MPARVYQQNSHSIQGEPHSHRSTATAPVDRSEARRLTAAKGGHRVPFMVRDGRVTFRRGAQRRGDLSDGPAGDERRGRLRTPPAAPWCHQPGEGGPKQRHTERRSRVDGRGGNPPDVHERACAAQQASDRPPRRRRVPRRLRERVTGGKESLREFRVHGSFLMPKSFAEGKLTARRVRSCARTRKK